MFFGNQLPNTNNEIRGRLVEFEDLIDPGHTVLLLVECQNGVIGSNSSFPALSEVVDDGLRTTLGELAGAARLAGVKIVHGVSTTRSDEWGSSSNARLFRVAKKSMIKQYADTFATAPINEVGCDKDSDLLLPRLHGLAPTSGTELHSLLRNEQVTTVVVAGVSLNIAIPNTVFDLVNAGHQVVVPVDAVVGVPPEYGELVLEHSLSMVATLVDSGVLKEAWSVSQGAPNIEPHP